MNDIEDQLPDDQVDEHGTSVAANRSRTQKTTRSSEYYHQVNESQDQQDQHGELAILRQLKLAQESELARLRSQLREVPKRLHSMEKRVLDCKRQLSQSASQNAKLDTKLREARNHILALRAEVDQLTSPPSSYGVVLARNEDDTVDVLSSGRKMRVAAHPGVGNLRGGEEVVLNESLNVILARRPDRTGEVVIVKEVFDNDSRALITGRSDEERVVELGPSFAPGTIRRGDSVLIDSSAFLVLERLPRPQVEALLLEEVPNVSYEDVGGLDAQIEKITDAVELPFIHQNLFSEYDLLAPKGVLLYGPPGCGKTLIAKAVANSLTKKVAEISENSDARSCFLNVKGPELLNKYVGETERQIRLVFQRAREKSEQGYPVIVFFDEMESLFRTRGSGISSDVESTIVPQLLAEIDGVEELRNVIVIGASNREDLIDPAILRPGRLDVKIRIDRPDEDAAAAIFSRYLTYELPIDPLVVDNDGGGDPNKAIKTMIEQTVESMYRVEERNRFLEVTYANGDKETMYFRDFASGAMIENVVRRAKKLAIKREIATGQRGICLEDLLISVRQEFKEHEDLPNTTNPDDWARIAGKKGERIVFVRTLVSDLDRFGSGGRSIEQAQTGQYL